MQFRFDFRTDEGLAMFRAEDQSSQGDALGYCRLPRWGTNQLPGSTGFALTYLITPRQLSPGRCPGLLLLQVAPLGHKPIAGIHQIRSDLFDHAEFLADFGKRRRGSIQLFRRVGGG
jgi:hypothetical protein